MNSMVKSAHRVLEIFDTFEREQRPLSTTDLSRLLTVPQSSMSGLLKTLKASGYLDFDPVNWTYQPSVKVGMLGRWALDYAGYGVGIENLLNTLSAETGKTIILATEIDICTQYIRVLLPDNVRDGIVKPGTERLMHRSSAGLVLLSLKKNDEIYRILTRTNAEYGKRETPQAEPSKVMEAVNFAREKGYFASKNLATPGAGVIAAPLTDKDNPRPLVIGIGGRNETIANNHKNLFSTLHDAINSYKSKPAQFNG